MLLIVPAPAPLMKTERYPDAVTGTWRLRPTPAVFAVAGVTSNHVVPLSFVAWIFFWMFRLHLHWHSHWNMRTEFFLYVDPAAGDTDSSRVVKCDSPFCVALPPIAVHWATSTKIVLWVSIEKKLRYMHIICGNGEIPKFFGDNYYSSRSFHVAIAFPILVAPAVYHNLSTVPFDCR